MAWMENRWGASARFGTAPTRHYFFTAAWRAKAAELPQSKTLARASTAKAFSVVKGFWKTR
jgi:hypothetical protein